MYQRYKLTQLPQSSCTGMVHEDAVVVMSPLLLKMGTVNVSFKCDGALSNSMT